VEVPLHVGAGADAVDRELPELGVESGVAQSVQVVRSERLQPHVGPFEGARGQIHGGFQALYESTPARRRTSASSGTLSKAASRSSGSGRRRPVVRSTNTHRVSARATSWRSFSRTKK